MGLGALNLNRICQSQLRLVFFVGSFGWGNSDSVVRGRLAWRVSASGRLVFLESAERRGAQFPGARLCFGKFVS